jgi:hypothetical protein
MKTDPIIVKILHIFYDVILPVLWIRIAFMVSKRIRIRHFRSMGFDHQNLLHLAAGKIPIFYLHVYKIAIYLSRGLHEGRPSYRRSLQPSKENIKHFKT